MTNEENDFFTRCLLRQKKKVLCLKHILQLKLIPVVQLFTNDINRRNCSTRRLIHSFVQVKIDFLINLGKIVEILYIQRATRVLNSKRICYVQFVLYRFLWYDFIWSIDLMKLYIYVYFVDGEHFKLKKINNEFFFFFSTVYLRMLRVAPLKDTCTIQGLYILTSSFRYMVVQYPGFVIGRVTLFAISSWNGHCNYIQFFCVERLTWQMSNFKPATCEVPHPFLLGKPNSNIPSSFGWIFLGNMFLVEIFFFVDDINYSPTDYGENRNDYSE